MRVGIVVENDAPFVSDEVRCLREVGLSVAVASVFRPLPPGRWERRFGERVAYPTRGLPAWAAATWPAVASPSRVARLSALALREGAPVRLVALAVDAARRARRERWAHVHGTFATFPAWMAWAAALLADLPFSFSAHAYDVQAPRPWLPRLVRDAAFVRAISREGAMRLRRLAESPVAARGVRVGYLGVDTARFHPPAAPRAHPDEIVCVAHLGPTKGHAVLIDAMGALARRGRAVRLRLLGEGPLRAALERRVRALGLEGTVAFEGAASRHQVQRALERACIFALPCTVLGAGRHDGLPVAILEAMAAGLPVVSTAVGGIPEAIACGRNGRLVAAGDAHALANVLEGLLRDPAERARLGAAARRTACARFDGHAAARRLFQWIAESAGQLPIRRARTVSCEITP